jgi:hypothetical protein
MSILDPIVISALTLLGPNVVAGLIVIVVLGYCAHGCAKLFKD